MFLKSNFPFGYYFLLSEILLGLLSVLRLAYLLFPHVFGHRYFRWRQSRDDLLHSLETAKNLLLFTYEEYLSDVILHDPTKLDLNFT